MSDATVLSKLLKPVSIHDFVEHFFLKQPLHLRGDEEKFKFLFEIDDFKQGLEEAADIRAVFPLLRQATIRIPNIPDMLRAGATICVTGPEFSNVKLREAAGQIAHSLNYLGRVSFRCYLSPTGCGFDLHYDARAATAIQIGGRKRWWYKVNKDKEFPLENSPRPDRLKNAGHNPPAKEDMECVDLSPGDLLHLPAGTWHCAKALEDSLSLNLAFDHKSAGVVTTLARALVEKAQSEPINRCPLFALGPEPWRDGFAISRTKSAAFELQGLLAELLEDDERITELLKAQFGISEE